LAKALAEYKGGVVSSDVVGVVVEEGGSQVPSDEDEEQVFDDA
jgi:hypothetical protein